jgi:small subunit ribosomal protein S1
MFRTGFMSSDVPQSTESSIQPAATESAPLETEPADAPAAPVESADSAGQAADAAVAVAEEPAAAEPVPVSEAPVGEQASQPTEESSAPVDESSEPTALSSDADSESRRVQLNPTGGDELKAVPNPVSESAVAAPVEVGSEDGAVASTDEEILAAAADLASAVRDVVEIEIPREVELGSLEAEIEAAMAGDAQQAEATKGADASQDLPDAGARLEGVVHSIHGDDVFLDLGFRIPGILQLRQFEGTTPPEVGKKLRVAVSKVDENEGLIAVNLPSGKSRPGGNWDAVEKGQVVDCMVQKMNKGGLEVQIGGLRGFMPAGQVDMHFVGDLSAYVGQKLPAKIIEVNQQKRNLVVSRRALLMEEREAQEEEFWESIQEDVEFIGRVKTLKDYGAFVDLGGADGFLHIGQISWTHIKHPSEVLTEGQEVNVKVIKVDRDKKRIGLGMKELSQDPWLVAAETYTPESIVTGKVTRATDFGAFVELEPGIEGLIHISQLDWKRVRKVTDVVQEGKEITAKVLEFDLSRRRISLSVKAMSQDPRVLEEAAREAELAALPPIERREDLKGGIGQPESGGGLFGNPSDFG